MDEDDDDETRLSVALGIALLALDMIARGDVPAADCAALALQHIRDKCGFTPDNT